MHLVFLLKWGVNMDKRTERISFRVTPNELAIIEKKIKKSNLSKSEYLRRVALGKEIIVIEGMNDVIRELRLLRGISNNINRLTILAQQGRLKILDVSILKEFEELREKVDSIWPLLNSLMGKIKK